MKEHRSERPPIWDYSNPRAEKRVSLRKKLAVSDPPKKKVEPLAEKPPSRKGRKKK
jgi:hypothetical protein